MTELQVLDIVYRALREANFPEIDDVTQDNDHKSGEIIITTDDGKQKQDWVIRSRDITETDRDYDFEEDDDGEDEEEDD